MRVWTRTEPKRGHAPDQNEDAAAHAHTGGSLRACIADGATESAYSADWARLLAAEFVRAERFDGAWPAWSRQAAARSADVPWYVAAKAEQGAHAAALGLSLECDRWSAWATGDCALFALDAHLALIHTWPFDDAEAFGNAPDLFDSRQPTPPILHTTGRLVSGGHLLLATDAVAAFLLADTSRVHPLVEAVQADAHAFAAWAEASRRAGMRNDDSTVLLISP
jgi:hypothetical protein